jgi:hypothetical protein
LLGETVRHVYVYRPYPVFGVRLAVWGEDLSHVCWRFVYDTGSLVPEYSNSFHTEVEARMLSTSRGMSETVAALIEEMWPETIAQLESFLRQRGPLRSERTVISSKELNLLIEHADLAHLLDRREVQAELDCVDGNADRVLTRTDDGRESDLLCAEWSGYAGSAMERFICLAWELAGYPLPS